ncbi:MAG TPA: SurA N-terminal domain-containing protein [Nitrospirota bacterium]|nr:SurA N-terminal domain-containing protein [Nitrospirota bacterium]
MKRLKLTIVFTLALAIAASGCNKSSDSAVLARVNRSSITVSDFKKQLEELDPRMQQAVVTDPKARKEFLEDLIGIEVVLQEARRQGLDKDAEFKKRQEAIRKKMEQRIQEDAKNELFSNLLKKELADKMSKLPMPTDKEVYDFYTKNKDKMRNEVGKQLSLKEVEPQIKRRLMQEKQRDLYLEYAKGLRSKAKISIDEKALDAAAAAFSLPSQTNELQSQAPPATKEENRK